MTVKNLHSIRPIFRARKCILCGKSWRFKHGLAWTQDETGEKQHLCPDCKPPTYIDTPSKVGKFVGSILESRRRMMPPSHVNCRCRCVPTGYTIEDAVQGINAMNKAQRDHGPSLANLFKDKSSKVEFCIRGTSNPKGYNR